MLLGLESQAALDDGATDEALDLARAFLRETEAETSLSSATFGEALTLLAEHGDAAASDERERLRWWLLRWSPRHDSGVVYAKAGSQEIWAQSMYFVVPMLALTRDFAPADMQYRMHREHLWDPASGRYRERYDFGEASVPGAPSAAGSGWAAAAIARALHVGADGTPAEMRERWRRETRALIEACADDERPEAAAMLAYATYTGIADAWLPDAYSDRADAWAACAHQVTTASGRAFARMARAARARG